MTSHTHENPHAGKGSSVPLDIGGTIGALVIQLPPDLEDQEIELHPTGHGNDHHLPHVAVVPRLAADGTIIHSAVFPELHQGTYHLAIRPDNSVHLTVTVHGGKVTEATWPDP
jgi:hypothetical protein